jgi:two-component system NtrC family sensor kinase
VARANVRAAELLADAAPAEGSLPDAAVAGAPAGHTPRALLGTDFAARLCGGPGAAAAPGGVEPAAAVRALLAAGRRERARVRVPGATLGAGRVFDVLVAPHPAGGSVVTFDDVTAQVALAERHRLVVETSRDALLITDRRGRVVYANPAAVALFGRGDALVGSRAIDLVRADEAGALVERAARTRLDGPLEYEFTAVRPDGEERVLAVTAAPLRELGDAGPASGVVASLRDVTDERRAARGLVEREKLAAMGQLVGGVAHELNNPLAGVLAMSELMLGEPLLADPADDSVVADAEARGELRELATAVHHEARRAARTVARLLDFARQHAPRRAATDVNAALGSALDLRRSSLRLAGVSVELAPDPALPPAWADAHQLQQVFLNLITNAEHALAGHAGPRRLTLRTRALERAGARWVAAEVADSGPGLTPAESARVFEPFYTTKPAGEGTGLGLAVSLGIVREHGGELRVESVPGAGATFVVELPAAAADIGAEDA